MKNGAEFGLSIALPTPFEDNGAIDAARLAEHASDMLMRGAASVTLFGTTGEGASIGIPERPIGIEAIRGGGGGGVPAHRTIVGICGTSVADVATQVRQGQEFGIRDFLLPPPFYFSSVGDSGLFEWYSQVFCAAGPEARFILYNIPQVTGVRLTPRLVAQLGAAFPDLVLAVKDSSGDWSYARSLLEHGAVPVLIGDERLLHRAVRLGCAGSITGVGNLYPERICRILDSALEDAAVSEAVERIVSGPVVPGLKALLATAKGDPGWRRVRPPLTSLESVA